MKTRGPRAVKSLPFDQWPSTDRIDWEQLYPASPLLAIFLPSGIKQAVLAEQTVRNHIYFMSLYLRWLTNNSPATMARPLADRFEPDLIQAFAAESCSPKRMLSRSVSNMLSTLSAIAQRFNPQKNLRWLSRLANSYQAPKSATKSVTVPAWAAFKAGIRLMDTAKARLNAYGVDAGAWERRAIAERYRNGLMICLMSVKPLRSFNVRTLQLKDMTKVNGHFSLYIGRERVKNGVAVFLKVPTTLTNYIDDYVRQFRPLIPNSDRHDFIFPSRFGRLSTSGLWLIITKIMKETFKVHLSPHDVRRIVANSVIRNEQIPVSHVRLALDQTNEDMSNVNYVSATRGRVAKLLVELTDV